MYQLAIYYGRLVRCRKCGYLARGPSYCEQCGALLSVLYGRSIERPFVLLAALYALALAALLSVLIAAALAVPPGVSAVCMADGHNCHKIEMRH